MGQRFSPNSVFNDTKPKSDKPQSDDKRRLLKAFHAFKADPSMYNVARIENAVNSATDTIYVENAVKNFTQTLFGRPKYEGFVTHFNQLLDQ